MSQTDIVAAIRVTCWNCSEEDGFCVAHECGKDSCACADPQMNVPCDVCGGKGYWLLEATDENFKALAKSLEDLEYEELDEPVPRSELAP